MGQPNEGQPSIIDPQMSDSDRVIIEHLIGKNIWYIPPLMGYISFIVSLL